MNYFLNFFFPCPLNKRCVLLLLQIMWRISTKHILNVRKKASLGLPCGNWVTWIPHRWIQCWKGNQGRRPLLRGQKGKKRQSKMCPRQHLVIAIKYKKYHSTLVRVSVLCSLTYHFHCSFLVWCRNALYWMPWKMGWMLNALSASDKDAIMKYLKNILPKFWFSYLPIRNQTFKTSMAHFIIPWIPVKCMTYHTNIICFKLQSLMESSSRHRPQKESPATVPHASSLWKDTKMWPPAQKIRRESKWSKMRTSEI